MFANKIAYFRLNWGWEEQREKTFWSNYSIFLFWYHVFGATGPMSFPVEPVKDFTTKINPLNLRRPWGRQLLSPLSKAC